MADKKSFSVYKGLQKPLVYKGFRGRYMYWAIGFVALGLFLGGAISTMVNLISGLTLMATCFGGGIYYTSQRQKNGLYDKTRNIGIYVHKTNLRGMRNVKSKSN
ncbi:MULTISPECIES: plasmid transfer protein [Sphingobacterium]|uniref:plasmid transfer protein n=1 Tax=Sphingobacterium TaxID=28453 RepID=UPI00257E80A6|nr:MULTISPECIES: plasmid transfer protein [Sphingobacterium]